MKNNKNVISLLIIQLLTIIIVYSSVTLFFGIPFEAGDNMWSFPRLYFEVYSNYSGIIVIWLCSGVSLMISILIKNNLNQSYGRVLATGMNYLLKIIIALTLISSLSAMHTLYNQNNVNSFMSLNIFTIPLTIILVILCAVITYREYFSLRS